MKKILPLLFVIVVHACQLFAQPLTYGQQAPDFTSTDISGNTWHLQELLDAGQSVVLMFGNVESTNLFDVLNTNILQYDYALQGPNGSNETQMLFIESNPDNLTSDIYGPPGSGIEDLTTLAPCPIIDGDQALIDLYQYEIEFGTPYQEYYVIICPYGVIIDFLQLTSPSLVFDIAHYDCADLYMGYDIQAFFSGVTTACHQFWTGIYFYNTGIYPSEAGTAEFNVNGTIYTYDVPAGILPLHPYIITVTDLPFEGIFPATLTFSGTDEVAENNFDSDNILGTFTTSTHLKLNFTSLTGASYNIHGVDVGQPPSFWDIATPGMVTSFTQNIYLPDTDCNFFQYTIDSPNNDYSLEVYSIGADGSEELLVTVTPTYPNIDGGTATYLKFDATELVPAMISGYVFQDLDTDGVMDSNEPGIGGIALQYGSQTIYTDNNGLFYLLLPGDFGDILTLQYDNTVWPTLTTPSSINTSTGFIGSAFFGLNTSAPNYDINGSVSLPPLVCAQSGEIDVMINNESNSISSAVIHVTTDANINMTMAYPMPDNVNGNDLTWNLNNMAPGASQLLRLFFSAPDYSLMGSPLSTIVDIQTLDINGNLISTENIFDTEILLCAWDPNQITATPAGTGSGNIIDPGTEIEYLIEFQNTGNAPATDIVVSNALDSDLDYSTFEWIGASHECHPIVNLVNGQLSFEFPQIMLPDSTSDEPNSHGWLRYKVHAQSNLAPGTAIDNTAYIYFDQNPAVVTNTYTHHIILVGLNETSPTHFNIYPNPAHDEIFITNPMHETVELIIQNAQNAMVKKLRVNNQTSSVSIGDLSPGLYFISLTGADGERHMTRLVKQ